MGREAWWATVHGAFKEYDVPEHTHTHIQGKGLQLAC